MRGPSEDPGLYTRVLDELFKVRREKLTTNKISLTMVITEIYNESLRDLLNTNQKAASKVDIKIQTDGGVQLTNVVEKGVQFGGRGPVHDRCTRHPSTVELET